MYNNIALGEVTGQSVGGGATVTVMSGVPLAMVNKIYAAVKAGAAHDFDVNVTRTGFKPGDTRGDIIAITVTGDNVAVTDSAKDATAPKVDVSITNNDTVSHAYDAYLGGLRG